MSGCCSSVCAVIAAAAAGVVSQPEFASDCRPRLRKVRTPRRRAHFTHIHAPCALYLCALIIKQPRRYINFLKKCVPPRRMLRRSEGPAPFDGLLRRTCVIVRRKLEIVVCHFTWLFAHINISQYLTKN